MQRAEESRIERAGRPSLTESGEYSRVLNLRVPVATAEVSAKSLPRRSHASSMLMQQTDRFTQHCGACSRRQTPRLRAAEVEGQIRANPDARGGLRMRRFPSQTSVFRVLLRDAQYERGQVRLNPG